MGFDMRRRTPLQFGLITLLLVVAITPALIYLAYLYARPRPALIVALTSRDRDLVYVALTILRDDGISVPKRIDIQGPFSKAEPELTELVNEVSGFEKQRLDSLDRAYAGRLFIHSPMGLDNYWK